MLAAPALSTLSHFDALSRRSANAVLREWAAEELPKGTVVFLPPFFNDDLRDLPLRVLTLTGVGSRQYRLPPDVGLSPEKTPIFAPELVPALLAQGVEYVISSSQLEGSFGPSRENLRWFPRSVAAYAGYRRALEELGDEVFAVRGGAEGRLGGDIVVYRLDR